MSIPLYAKVSPDFENDETVNLSGQSSISKTLNESQVFEITPLKESIIVKQDNPLSENKNDIELDDIDYDDEEEYDDDEIPKNKIKLLVIAANFEDRRCFKAIKSLNERGNFLEKTIALRCCENLSKIYENKNAFDALEYLQTLPTISISECISRTDRFLEMIKSKTISSFPAAEKIIRSNRTEKLPIKIINAVCCVRQDPNLAIMDNLYIYKAFWYLREIMNDFDHEKQIDAIGLFRKYGCEQDKSDSEKILIKIMNDSNYKNFFKAAMNYYSEKYDRLLGAPCNSYQGMWTTCLFITCCSPCYFGCFLPYKLFNCFNCYKRRNFFTACNIINHIASQINHKDVFTAIKFVYDNRFSKLSGNCHLDKENANNTLRLIAQTENHIDQLKAINLLMESNRANDQTLGSEMKAKYFPEQLNPRTIKRKEQFNLELIRSVMPPPLEDLSKTDMNLTQEFIDLLDKISIVDGDPYYLSPDAIDPEWNNFNSTIEFYVTIRSRAIGFIKSLEGKRLNFGETGGWKMYDENKPDMINSLKHIIINIKLNIDNDPQSALVSFGIILNSLLYCPTGQAEGIESAVNIIVRGKNEVSTNIKEVIGKFVISSSVQKAFMNAFHDGGGVHALSRARKVLGDEIGMIHSISSYVEKISPVLESDKPSYFNKFYREFDVEFIVTEFKRNIQTEEEFNFITNVKNSTDRIKADRIKREKPINIGQITKFLYDNNCEMYGISEDFKTISDRGIINLLTKLEYLTDCEKNRRLLL
jgi:hypothetical protein